MGASFKIAIMLEKIVILLVFLMTSVIQRQGEYGVLEPGKPNGDLNGEKQAGNLVYKIMVHWDGGQVGNHIFSTGMLKSKTTKDPVRPSKRLQPSVY